MTAVPDLFFDLPMPRRVRPAPPVRRAEDAPRPPRPRQGRGSRSNQRDAAVRESMETMAVDS
jgi:hypothetical protein